MASFVGWIGFQIPCSPTPIRYWLERRISGNGTCAAIFESLSEFTATRMRCFVCKSIRWFMGVAVLVQLQAAEPFPDDFGGFKPGKKFTFTVNKVVCDKSRLAGGIREEIPIPKDFPVFRVGDKLITTIGRRGQFKGPGFSFLLIHTSRLENYYVSRGGIFNGGDGLMYKSSRSKPSSVRLSFDKLGGDGNHNTILKRVEYHLDP